MGRFLAVGLSLLALAGVTRAGDSPDPRVEALRAHAIAVRTIDPADDDFSDLQRLKPLLEGVRVVQLGEESHGDGACFLAKTRLIRFLHREMGFDVLAFESGLHGCELAWKALREEGRDPVDALAQGVFGIWTSSAQLRPLARHLAAEARSERPLRLCGFDCQITSQASREALVPDLERVLGAEGVRDPRWAAGRRALDALMQHDAAYDAAAQQALEAAMALVRERAVGEEAGYWRQLAASLVAQGGLRRDQGARPGGRPEAGNARDAQMAENLIWWATERFPKRKIVVWAATFHVMRNAAAVRALELPVDYARTKPMGDAVARRFGRACYTIGFTAHEGEAGVPWRAPRRLASAAPGTFEALCAQAGLTDALVDLRDPPPAMRWLHEPLVARPLGYSPMRAPWHEVLDALFFQRVMTPSTREAAAPAAAPGGLAARLDAQWTRIQAASSQGNPWAVKWTFAQPLREWRSAERADVAAMQAQEPAVRRWLAAHASEPGAAWRAQALLGDMAAARGDAGAATAAYDAALDAFPKHDMPEPAKFSQFQHVANERAMRTWDAEGFDAALRWAMGRLAEDRRFRTFYAEPWRQRATAVEARRLETALAEAREARKARFPDLRAEIDGWR